MYRGMVILFGILGVLLSLCLGYYTVVTWDIVAVLVAVSIGIPSLILTYEKVKPEGSITQRKTERKHEKERIKPPTPSRKGEEQKSELLRDTADITALNVDDSLLDSIYEKAHRKAIGIYHDAQLSGFALQVFPFRTARDVNIYLNFYSKWADKNCLFAYRADSPQVKHSPPDKRVKFASDREVFTTLPWKASPEWMEFLKRAYSKIRPLTPATDSGYHLIACPNQEKRWRLSFEDGFTGNEYVFEWDGRGLDEKSVKQLS